MIYVAGYGRPTINNISDFAQLDSLDAYETTAIGGDGTVPHELGVLRTADGETVKTYFVDASHTSLPRDDRVVAALENCSRRELPGHSGNGYLSPNRRPWIRATRRKRSPSLGIPKKNVHLNWPSASGPRTRVRAAPRDA
jgi:hypothetical protein